jgi:hypothetical protein
MRPAITALPHHIIEDILFEACASPHPPPCPISAFASTCRDSYVLVTVGLTNLCARLFAHCFDPPKAAGNACRVETPRIRDEFHKRAIARRWVRQGALSDSSINSADLVDVLSTIYLMMLEDTGRNADHLRSWGLLDQLVTFICDRLFDGAAENNGWPVSSPLNSLVLALLAGLTRSGASYLRPYPVLSLG